MRGQNAREGIERTLRLPGLQLRDREEEHQWVNHLKSYIRRCDELGFDIWGVDHLLTAAGLYGQSWLDPLALLSFAAAQTERSMLGTGILVAPLRDPVLLAKEIASLARLSNNRFILGAGAGWDPAEFSAVGMHVSERGTRLDEVLEAVRILLNQDGASYHGKYYNFDDVTIAPRPMEPVPIWASGGSRLPDLAFRDKSEMPAQVIRRIGVSDAWISRCSGNQELLLRDMVTVREYLDGIGRDPSTLRSLTATSSTSNRTPVILERWNSNNLMRQPLSENTAPTSTCRNAIYSAGWITSSAGYRSLPTLESSTSSWVPSVRTSPSWTSCTSTSRSTLVRKVLNNPRGWSARWSR
jgi:hypothetical protein